MRVSSFAEIEQEFVARVNTMVWCSMATVDAAGRPRSRVVHTIWEGNAGWIGARRHSPKGRDLAGNPCTSLAYIADLVRPVYLECIAGWADDAATKAHVWELFRAAPPPLGYDPAPIYSSVTAPDFGVLRLTPWRIELSNASGAGERRIVWHADAFRASPPAPP
jgi:general stress protein 26